ncbi:hypothetical protein EK904_015061 [Melospiza melodia maxima]|nr:hypothetical protein EK904_015061 [Melospiza melodia maxima]
MQCLTAANLEEAYISMKSNNGCENVCISYPKAYWLKKVSFDSDCFIFKGELQLPLQINVKNKQSFLQRKGVTEAPYWESMLHDFSLLGADRYLFDHCLGFNFDYILAFKNTFGSHKKQFQIEFISVPIGILTVPQILCHGLMKQKPSVFLKQELSSAITILRKQEKRTFQRAT